MSHLSFESFASPDTRHVRSIIMTKQFVPHTLIVPMDFGSDALLL